MCHDTGRVWILFLTLCFIVGGLYYLNYWVMDLSIGSVVQGSGLIQPLGYGLSVGSAFLYVLVHIQVQWTDLNNPSPRL
jgi:hypothetical protein